VETDNSHFLQCFNSVSVNGIPPTPCLSDEQCLKSVDMKLFRKTASCSLLDQKRNELIIADYLQQYRRNWLQHINGEEASEVLCLEHSFIWC
jgi:hypothetical protein